MKTATASTPTTVKPEPRDVHIGKILVPIDFSQSSQQALDFADAFAKHFGAELHLVHVFAPRHPFADSAVLPLVLPPHEIVPRIRRDLQKLAHSLTVAGLNIHAIAGNPFEQICGVARQQKVDLIVVPTRGNTGLSHLVLGSTAERIVRSSPCPVLVIRSEKRSGTAPDRSRPRNLASFRRILVPVDFSLCSLSGLAYAKTLATHFDSQLMLLHAVHLETYVSPDEFGRYDLPMAVSGAESLAGEQMRALVKIEKWNGLNVETSIEVGHPGQQICERATDRGADLIVTSTHGYSGLKHVFLGSTAEYVVRHAKCPVLVVPSHPRPALDKQDS
jgi:nucleotide-binding universal stress UspA family protein